MISQAEHARLRGAIDAFERAREQYDPKRYKRGGGYDPKEYAAIARMAGLTKEPSNEDKSKVEVYEFYHDPPEKYFAYYDKALTKISGWMGDKLGDIVSKGSVYEVGFRQITGRRGRAVNVRVRAINGLMYSGTCYLDAGDYCRLKLLKGQKKNPLTRAETIEIEHTARQERIMGEQIQSPGSRGYALGHSDGMRHVMKKYGTYARTNPGKEQAILAENFVKGANSGVASSMYIHGNTIYSYGPHFPIARRDGELIVITTKKSPSRTTSGHIGLVKNAARQAGKEVIYQELMPEAAGPAAYSNPMVDLYDGKKKKDAILVGVMPSYGKHLLVDAYKGKRRLRAMHPTSITIADEYQKNPLRFKDLGVGETFVFASEHDPRFLTSGMAKGPWIKNGTRTYEHVDDVGKAIGDRRYGGGRISVGSVNVEVIRITSSNPRGGSSVEQAARAVGLYVATWSPGDGSTRYRFFSKPAPGSKEYADYHQGDGIYTALGRGDAMRFIDAYRIGKSARGNPASRGRYARERVADPGRFDARSFRTVSGGRGHKIVVGCPKNHFHSGKCSVGTRAQSVLHPVGEAHRLARTGRKITIGRGRAEARVGRAVANPILQTVLLANPGKNPPISRVWDTLTGRRRYAALGFAGFPENDARYLASRSWSGLTPEAKRALIRGWAMVNPLTRKESAQILREARADVRYAGHFQAGHTRSEKSGQGYAKASVVNRFGPRGARRASSRIMHRAQNTVGTTMSSSSGHRARMNPGSVTIPFKEGQRIPIARARAWVEQYGTPELKKAFRDAERLQTKANKRPRFVTWKTLPIGDSREIEMVTALSHYGDTPDTYYKAPKGSRKGRHLYRHKWGEGGGKKSVPLLAAPSGKALIMPLGGRKVASDWLRH